MCMGRFVCKRRMFQPETLSRPEAEDTFAEISKQLKIRGLLRPSFGTLPASINSSSREKIREAGTRSAGEHVTVAASGR